MKDSVLFFMFSHRSEYFVRFYSKLLFLLIPFGTWLLLEMFNPGGRYVTSPVMLGALVILSIFCVFILALALYVKAEDCSRDLEFIRIDDNVSARALYALFALVFGLVATLAGHSLNVAYFFLILFFAFRDSHLKKAKRYLKISVPLALISVIAGESSVSLAVVVSASSSWLIQWIMAASVYCALNCLSSDRKTLSEDSRIPNNC